jgi:hypothetical protein
LTYASHPARRRPRPYPVLEPAAGLHLKRNQVPASDIADARLVRIGTDDRGIELEIMAPGLDDAIYVTPD